MGEQKGTRVAVVCRYCGRVFYCIPSTAKEQKFCSNRCNGLSRRNEALRAQVRQLLQQAGSYAQVARRMGVSRQRIHQIAKSEGIIQTE